MVSNLNNISEKTLRRMIQEQLHLGTKTFAKKNIKTSWSDDVISHLAKQGWHEELGLKPMKVTIHHDVTNMLAENILSGKISSGSNLELVMDNENISFSIKTVKSAV